MMQIRSIRLAAFSALVVSAFLAVPAYAQYVGPNDGALAQNVGAILKKPVDEQAVRLEGHLVRMVGHEQYIFSDGTGEIIAEIDDKDLPKQSIDDKTKVEIVGEVDTGWSRPPEIEVDTVRVIQ